MDLSIKSIKENWNKKSTAQKVGTVAGTAVAAAAIGVTTAAAIRGGKLHKVDLFEKNADGKWAKKANEAAKDAKFTDKIKGAWNTLVDGFKSIFKKENREAYKNNKIAETVKEINKDIKAEKAAAKAAKKAEKAETPKEEPAKTEQ